MAQSDQIIKLFDLPQEETIFDDFGCSFQCKMLTHGRLFVTEHFVCFYSSMFGFKTKKVVEIKKIVNIEKKKDRLNPIIKNVLVISTQEGVCLSFCAFTDMNACINLIKSIINGKPMMVSQESQENREKNSIESNTSPEIQSAEQKQQNSIELLAQEIETSTVSSDQQILQKQSYPQPQQQQPISDERYRSKTVQPSLKSQIQSLQQQQLQQQQELRKVYTVPIASLSQQMLNPSSNVIETEIFNFIIPLSLDGYYNAFIKDDAPFNFCAYRKIRGDTNMTTTGWMFCEEVQSFTSEYKAIVKAKGIPFRSTTRVIIASNFKRLPDKLTVVMLSNALDVPYGGYFEVGERWEVTKHDAANSKHDECLLRRFVWLSWNKTTMLKKTIEPKAIQSVREEALEWLAQVNLHRSLWMVDEAVQESPANRNDQILDSDIQQKEETKQLSQYNDPNLFEQSRTLFMDNSQSQSEQPLVNQELGQAQSKDLVESAHKQEEKDIQSGPASKQYYQMQIKKYASEALPQIKQRAKYLFGEVLKFKQETIMYIIMTVILIFCTIIITMKIDCYQKQNQQMFERLEQNILNNQQQCVNR